MKSVGQSRSRCRTRCRRTSEPPRYAIKFTAAAWPALALLAIEFLRGILEHRRDAQVGDEG